MPIQMYDLAAGNPAVRFSPFCWRTRLALLHKGLDFETIPWRFTEKQALAPSGQDRVPVIIDTNQGNRWVHDSWQIAQYLDRTYPDRPLLMPTAADTAAARFVATWAETSVQMAAFPLVIIKLFEGLAPEDRDYFRSSRERRFGRQLEEIQVNPKAGVEGVTRALAPAEQALSVSAFLGGTAPSYADYALAGSLMWVWVASPIEPFDQASAIGNWFTRILDRFDGHCRKAPLMR